MDDFWGRFLTAMLFVPPAAIYRNLYIEPDDMFWWKWVGYAAWKVVVIALMRRKVVWPFAGESSAEETSDEPAQVPAPKPS